MADQTSPDVPTVGQVMSPEPVVLGVDQPAHAAAQVLEANDVSGAPVVDQAGVLVGVLSETDLVHARAKEHLWSRWSELTVRDLMHAPVITADRSMSVTEAARLMETAQVHRLVVMDDDQQTPIGVVSTSDLVRAMVSEREGRR